jgi:hypothetical protein
LAEVRQCEHFDGCRFRKANRTDTDKQGTSNACDWNYMFANLQSIQFQ